MGNTTLSNTAFADAIQARTGITPDAFALSTYDVLFVVRRALEDVRDLRNFANFKAAFVNESIAETQPQLQPFLLRLSAIISQ
jgi:hypothetical protein